MHADLDLVCIVIQRRLYGWKREAGRWNDCVAPVPIEEEAGFEAREHSSRIKISF